MKALGTIGPAIAASSLLGVALLAMVARWLSPAENAEFIALWGLLFGGGSVLALIEQETARLSALAETRGEPVPASAWQVGTAALAGNLLLLAAYALSPASGSVLGVHRWAVLVVAVAWVGLAAQFLSRGVLLGHRLESAYAVIILVEPVLRAVAVGALIAAGVGGGPETAIVCVMLGSFGWVVLGRTTARMTSWRHGATAWSDVVRRVVALAAGNGFLACILTGYPALVASVLGSSSGLEVFFALVTVSRVPLVLVSPLQALVIPMTTRALATGRGDLLGRMQRRLLLAVVGASTLAAAGGWLLGPWATRTLFGPSYQAGGALVAVMLAATVVLAGALLQAATFVSLERYNAVTTTWGVSLALTTTTLVMTPGGPVARGTAGFVVAALAGYATSVVLLRRALGGSEPPTRPVAT